jgi:hypothetical protein
MDKEGSINVSRAYQIGMLLAYESSLSRSARLLDTIHYTLYIMNRSGGEAFAKLAQQLNRARLQAQGGGGGKGGGQMPGFKGFMAGGGLLAVLAGGGLILNYSLFNGAFMILLLYLISLPRQD